MRKIIKIEFYNSQVTSLYSVYLVKVVANQGCWYSWCFRGTLVISLKEK